jgi:hypothetical protein
MAFNIKNSFYKYLFVDHQLKSKKIQLESLFCFM